MKYAQNKTNRLNAIRIVAIYALFAALWIYLSDHALGLLAPDRGFLVEISVLKGFLFIIVTGALLYQLIVRYMLKSGKIEEELRASQSLINALLEGTTDAIYVKDQEGRYLLFNAAATKITGKASLEVIGRDDTVLFPAEDAGALMAADRKVMARGQVMTIEERLPVADGTYRTFLATKGPIFNAAGEASGLFGIARDISERKQAEEAIRASEKRFHSLFENMLEGFAYCRMLYENDKPSDFVYLDVNMAFERLTGLKNSIGKKVSEVIPGIQTSNPELFEIYGRVASSGKPERFETYVAPLDHWFSVSVYCPEKECFVAVFDVITERKKAEDALRQSAQQLQTILDNTPAVIYLKDPQGRYVLINRRYEELFHKSRTAIQGITDYDLFPKAVADVLRENDLSVLEKGEAVQIDEVVPHDDGEHHYISVKFPLFDVRNTISGICGISTDITARNRAEEAREATVELLRICNKAEGLRELMKDLSIYFQRLTGCEAIGVRLKEGEDFPYYETTGFPEEFVMLEKSLCAIDQKGELVRDRAGHPALECMCGNIICGRFDPSKFFFTERGSFWSSCTSDLLARTTDADRQIKTRNRCNGEGYESVALVPLREHNETFGLFQFNDKRKGCFTADKIALLEDLVSYVAIALAKLKSDEALRESNQFNQQIINSAEEGVIVYGRDLRYQVWNPYMERLSGLEASKVLGKHPLEVFPFLKEAGVTEKIKKVVTGETVPPTDFRYDSSITGRSGWATDTNAPLRNRKGEIIGVIGTVRDITESKRVEEELRTLSHKIQLILNSAGEGIYGLDMDGNVTFINAIGAGMLGWDKEDLIGKNSHAIWHHSRPDLTPFPEEECGLQASLIKGDAKAIDHETFWKKDGSSFPVEYAIVPIYDNAILSGAVVTFKDITQRLNDEQEKIKLENQFRQAQKMEAIGHLAGGIAHDFNNILTAIIGYGNLLDMKIPPADPLHTYIDQILTSSEKATNLTHSLLAFSRKQVINLMPVNINEIVTGMKKILDRIIGEDIEFEVKTADRDQIVKSDKGQIEQVLMNLATNARDAMPHGGMLTIATGEEEIGERFVQLHQYGSAGRYAVLTVADTGIGMDKTTQQRMFEPFFTTKEVGKGTGLGLTMVYGTIKQHDGFINVYSESGVGTTFKIYLPLADSNEERTMENPSTAVLPGTETVLLVEDDSIVRKITKTLLEELGYSIIEAVDGKHAVELFRENRDRVQLVVSDMIMPKMNGNDVHNELKKIKPDLKILFISGYTADILRQKGIENEEINFISKPLRLDAFSRKVREVLDKPKYNTQQDA